MWKSFKHQGNEYEGHEATGAHVEHTNGYRSRGSHFCCQFHTPDLSATRRTEETAGRLRPGFHRAGFRDLCVPDITMLR